MYLVVDTETEGIDNPQKLWVAVVKELESGRTHVFRNLHASSEDRNRLRLLCSQATAFIGHNIIGFDLRVLERLAGVFINPSRVIDTLVVARLLNAGIEGGNSLEAIGERLGCPKIKFNEFSCYSKKMEEYCIQDVEVTYKYYKSIEPYIHSNSWRESLRLEHDIAFVCREMSENGFAFDINKAKEIYQEIKTKLEALDQELIASFPPKAVFIKEITPRATASGTIHRGDFRWLSEPDLTPFMVGATFSRFEYQPFNPGSPKQIVERLNEAGWNPNEKTKGHLQAEREGNPERLEYFRTYGWKVSEANLATLPEDAPEAARKLVQRLLLDSRRSTLEEWFNAYREDTGRIHGKFHHIGCWTQRMSHSGPNMANIPSGDTPYAEEMRSLWTVAAKNLLIGVDADGIQLRVLAHYMDDPEFTKALVNGRKEDGTDAHSVNKRTIGPVCRSRDDAKTFIYAFILGAGDPKIAEILGCNLRESKKAKRTFIEAWPGLKRLKEEIIPYDAARGYFYGLDGRAVLCDSEHHMLAGYLQNGEAVIMKKANLLWRAKLKELDIPFQQVNFVHDEWQTETSGDYELAKKIAEIQAASIKEAGILLNVKCPLEGSILNSHKEVAIGKNWAQTH